MELSSGRTWVIAHRGASADRPENTRAAFDEALRQGCDAIELDVQLTRDGVPLIHHDRTLARFGAKQQTIAQADWRQLRSLHLPTLDAVLERYARRTTLLVEIKVDEATMGPREREALVRAVLERLRPAEIERRTLLLSFDGRVLDLCAAESPRLRRVLNVKLPPYLPRGLRARLPALAALSVDIRTVTPLVAAALSRAGCPLLSYTCNTPRRVERALRAGVEGIISDRPGWLRAYLEQRRARSSA
ncbi:MAG TPA: glycerophosphodiester phosphodiesterase [Candidatus Polarisedimenticolaceae bacterium]|nr:glycerophosphodiester phosphodiesterase [Candidatus Polarisedimenticolaceae bacterium]